MKTSNVLRYYDFFFPLEQVPNFILPSPKTSEVPGPTGVEAWLNNRDQGQILWLYKLLGIKRTINFNLD